MFASVIEDVCYEESGSKLPTGVWLVMASSLARELYWHVLLTLTKLGQQLEEKSYHV